MNALILKCNKSSLRNCYLLYPVVSHMFAYTVYTIHCILYRQRSSETNRIIPHKECCFSQQKFCVLERFAIAFEVI